MTDPARRREMSLEEVRSRLAGRRGASFWRGLEELAGDEEFRRLLDDEFPRQAAVWPEGVDRRRFLQLAGASLAMAGLTACTRQPLEQIVPYVRQPEEIVPGRPLYFATAMELGGYAQPLLAESHMGRPTKVEGNPDHPAGTRGTDLFAQASVLGMYDPDRAQVVRGLTRIRTWSAFLTDTRAGLKALDALGGARLRLLTGTVTSPALAAAIGRLLARFPRARWHRWEPAGRHAAEAAAGSAFGRPLDTRYDFRAARVVVSLDADFLTSGPGHRVYARDFSAARRVRRDSLSTSRLYQAESTPTATGTLADHRLALAPAALAAATSALAAELGVAGVEALALADERTRAWVRAAARDLAAHRGASAVVAGDFAPPAVHVLAHAMNERLGNLGATVVLTEPVAAEPVDQLASLAELTADMAAGEVDVLLVAGSNPVFDAPADLDFRGALMRVPRRIRLGMYEDETGELCHWQLPEAHYLETWGDPRSFDGTVSLAQPLIEPLYDGRSLLEVVAALTEDAEPGGLDLLRAHWQERAPAGEDFERFWRRAVHDGFVPGTEAPAVAAAVDPAAVAAAGGELAAAGATDGLELLLRPDPTLWDGRFANNGWLQECPKPLTKLTWDNALLVAPATAERLGLDTGQVARVEAGGRAIEAPTWVTPGHPDGALTLHFGAGRTRAGVVGTGVGVDAYPLRTRDNLWGVPGAVVGPTAGRVELASTQLHNNIPLETREAEKRHLVRTSTVAGFARDPDSVRPHPHVDIEASLYPGFDYDGIAWGLAVDLSACTGCNACVVACQAENNIPVVGKEQVMVGREMHWLRVDRYYEGDLDDPAVHHQPVMCMHCEQAPCEVVCPVAATVHSPEGLNEMVYNRCVGTRYCSNNCPYKVRRFNFLLYNDLETPSLQLMRNPDVTVRSRGVMEKCTYCVQRIHKARIRAKTEEREIRDGEVVTACQQACPSQAIAFGDVNDPDSEVSRWKADPLDYTILSELGTRPRTSYLTKLRNPSPDLEAAEPESGAEGHG